MSGVAIVMQLLLGDQAVTDIAAQENIHAGTLPQGTALPALSIETISETDRDELAADEWRFVQERVQVTAYADDYAAAHDLIKAVKRACADKFPAVDGLQNVSVVSAGGGPEGFHLGASCPSRSYDFMASYEEPA